MKSMKNINRKNLQKQKKKTTKKIRMKFDRKKPKDDEIWKTNLKIMSNKISKN